MTIEIKGVGDLNKGAFLMLLSIIEYFKNNHGEKEIDFVAYFGHTFSKEAGKKHNIQSLIKTERKGIEFKPLIKMFPFNFRKKTGFYIEDDVDVILDASGFLYGDQWPVKSIKKNLSLDIRKYKSEGKKIILMPQAFGPFKDDQIKTEVEKILNNSDLVFARDEKSSSYLLETFGDRNNFFTAPDFTNLLSSSNDQNVIDGDEVLIIPNIKLVEATSSSREEIINCFKNVIEAIQNRGFKCLFLIHEGEKDEILAQDINSSLNEAIPIIIEPNARKQKGLIKCAYAVVSGRFHGLVSSLSQGVPSIALSWSHKYEMLLKDYSQERFLLDPNFINEEIIDEILNPEKNLGIRNSLYIESEKEKKRTLEMWKKVSNEIF